MYSPTLKSFFKQRRKISAKDASAAHSCLTKGLDWERQDRHKRRCLQIRFLIEREEWPAIRDAARRRVVRLADGRAMLSQAIKEAEEAREAEEREEQARKARENGWWDGEVGLKEEEKSKEEKEKEEDDEFPETDEELLQEFITFYRLLNAHYAETEPDAHWFVRRVQEHPPAEATAAVPARSSAAAPAVAASARGYDVGRS